MAHIHRKSGVTQYLIDGMQPIQGKKLATYEEILYFYNHYNEILIETQTNITREQDEIIRGLYNDESRLDRKLQDTNARQTIKIDKNIDDLNRMINVEKLFFPWIGYRIRRWIAIALRERHIHAPCANISNELQAVRTRKNDQVNNKQTIIQKECNKVKDSYDFLKENETYLYGSKGEEAVIKALSSLSDEYYVLNDVILQFQPALFWNKTGKHIKTCQIDHIVVGPTGIFVLETKNWTSQKIEKNSDKVQNQVDRVRFALPSYIRDYYSWILEGPEIFYVVVSKNTDWKLDYTIKVVSSNQLCDYISSLKHTLSDDTMKKFIGIITQPQLQRKKF
jgi:hypothetical protein